MAKKKTTKSRSKSNFKKATKPRSKKATKKSSIKKSAPTFFVNASLKDFFEFIRDKEVEMVGKAMIKGSDSSYLVERVGEQQKQYHKLKEDLSEHIYNQAILEPIVVLEEKKDCYKVLSGNKRFHACRPDEKVPCKIISKSEWKSFKFSNSDFEKAAYYLSYIGSAFSSNINDLTMFNFLDRLRDDTDYTRFEFRNVMKILGIKNSSPRQRDIRRIWHLVTNNETRDLIEKEYVSISQLKPDQLHRPFFDGVKAAKIHKKITQYAKDILSKPETSDEKKGNCVYRFKNYDRSYICYVINTCDDGGNPKKASGYWGGALPKYAITTKSNKLVIPSVTIDLDKYLNTNTPVVEKKMAYKRIVEIFYQLNHAAKELEKVVTKHKPGSSSTMKFSKVVHGEDYKELITKNEIIEYSNVFKLDKYLNERNPHSYSKNNHSIESVRTFAETQRKVLNFLNKQKEKENKEQEKAYYLKFFKEKYMSFLDNGQITKLESFINIDTDLSIEFYKSNGDLVETMDDVHMCDLKAKFEKLIKNQDEERSAS